MPHWGLFPLFGFLHFLLIIGLIIAIFKWRRNGRCHNSSFNALDMLEKRYVSGEIDEVEFKKIKENLQS